MWVLFTAGRGTSVKNPFSRLWLRAEAHKLRRLALDLKKSFSEAGKSNSASRLNRNSLWRLSGWLCRNSGSKKRAITVSATLERIGAHDQRRFFIICAHQRYCGFNTELFRPQFSPAIRDGNIRQRGTSSTGFLTRSCNPVCSEENCAARR